MKKIALDILGRLVMVAVFFTYPVFWILALPWAYLDSIGNWGYTTFASWKEAWKMYSPDGIRQFLRSLFAPLGKDY